MQEEAEKQVARLACPKCGSPDVRRSNSAGFLAMLQSVVGRWPFRCRSCRARFFRFAPPPPDIAS
jgi:predicted RNA-binding Zn-ribbon protein involved in translation (DUF1610 family)